jgi:S1-C subfamily serine protease
MKRLSLAALAGLVLCGLAASAPEAAGGQKPEDITKTVAPSVVRVEARNGVHKIATGVVIDKDGSIVTTALISPRDEKITVFTTDGKSHPAEFKGLDTQTNIAVIQVKGAALMPIALGRSSDLRPGAWIGVVGLSPEQTPAVTQGIVSSVADDRARLNVWVVPGMSGSPVVNAGGQMVGLLRGAYTDELPIFFEFRDQQVVGSGRVVSRAEAGSAGMAVAVPVDIVASVAADIRKSGRVERGWLGVSASDESGKVVVAAVEPKSPASMAKLQEGDVILKVGDRDLTSGQVLTREIRSRKPGTDVVLKVERDGKLLDVKVKLGEYSEEDARRELELNFPGIFRVPDRPQAPRVEPKKQVQPFRPGPEPRLPDFFSRKYIGLTVQALTKDLAAFFGVKDGAGLLVAEVNPDSPAQKAGLKAGDVILKAAGKTVDSGDALSALIQVLNKGDKLKLDLLRDKKPLTVEVEVEEERAGSDFLTWDFWPKSGPELRGTKGEAMIDRETGRAFKAPTDTDLTKLLSGFTVLRGRYHRI